jgi:hypothetical protein
MRWPLWARGVLCGVVWSLFMLVALPLMNDGTLNAGTVIAVLVGGVIFGALLVFVGGRAQRRMFAADDGTTLSGEERLTVVRALQRGAPPAEDRLRGVAHRIAQKRLATPRRVWFTVAVFGFMTVLHLYLALTDSPKWWAGIAVWPVLAVASKVTQDRQYRTARRYLDAEAAPVRA